MPDIKIKNTGTIDVGERAAKAIIAGAVTYVIGAGIRFMFEGGGKVIGENLETLRPGQQKMLKEPKPRL